LECKFEWKCTFREWKCTFRFEYFDIVSARRLSGSVRSVSGSVRSVLGILTLSVCAPNLSGSVRSVLVILTFVISETVLDISIWLWMLVKAAEERD
jgi:hypothetical protein